MSASSAAARAALVAEIKAAAITDLAADRVFDHEPNAAAGWPHPNAVTVSPGGFTATDWMIDVRVYVSLLNVDSKLAESELERLAEAVDHVLDATVPATQWVYGRPTHVQNCLIAHTTLPVPREDYF